MYKTSCRAEVVTSPRRSVTATSELTSARCLLTRLVSELGWARQKYFAQYLYKRLRSGSNFFDFMTMSDIVYTVAVLENNY